MKCILHPNQEIEFLCLDNECYQKLICGECIMEQEEHEIIQLKEFLKGLQNDQHDLIQGNNILFKINNFNRQSLKLKQDLSDFMNFRIEQNLQKFREIIVEEIESLKKLQMSQVQSKIESLINQNVILNGLYFEEVKETVLESFKKWEFQKSGQGNQELNSQFTRIFSGQSELVYLKQEVNQLFDEFNVQSEQLLNQNILIFQQNLERMKSFVQDYCQFKLKIQGTSGQEQAEEEEKKRGQLKTQTVPQIFEIQKNGPKSGNKRALIDLIDMSDQIKKGFYSKRLSEGFISTENLLSPNQSVRSTNKLKFIFPDNDLSKSKITKTETNEASQIIDSKQEDEIKVEEKFLDQLKINSPTNTNNNSNNNKQSKNFNFTKSVIQGVQNNPITKNKIKSMKFLQNILHKNENQKIEQANKTLEQQNSFENTNKETSINTNLLTKKSQNNFIKGIINRNKIEKSPSNTNSSSNNSKINPDNQKNYPNPPNKTRNNEIFIQYQ